jgi:predicted Zn-dependent peptidase
MKIKIETLRNGAVIIHARNPSMKTVAVVATVHVGSRHETEATNGISHLLEHMLFKGTGKYANATTISREIDTKGGMHNAFTNHETTSIQVRVASEYQAIGTDVAMELLCTPRLRAADLDRERPVVCDEIQMYDVDDRDQVEVGVEALLYGTNPLGRPIAGRKENVQGVDAKTLRSHYKQHYIGGHVAVALAGNYTETTAETVRKCLNATFKVPTKASGRRVETPPPPKHAQTLVQKAVQPRAFIRIGFAGPSPKNDKETAAFTLLGYVLGGYSSARLFSILREKHSLCYSVWSGAIEYADVSAMHVGMELEAENLSKALPLLGAELAKIAQRGVTATELAAVKSYMRGVVSLALENNLHVAKHLANDYLLYGRVETPEKALARYEAVTLREINKVARTYLQRAQTVINAPTEYMAAAGRLVGKYLETL